MGGKCSRADAIEHMGLERVIAGQGRVVKIAGQIARHAQALHYGL